MTALACDAMLPPTVEPGVDMFSLIQVLLAILLSTIVTAFVLTMRRSKQSRELQRKARELETQLYEQQKAAHQLESDHLRAKNVLEIEHHEIAKGLKEKSYKEGYDHGLVSSQKDQLLEITTLRSAHRDELAKCEAEAEKRGRAIAKMEHEAQVKAFSVEIRPYVRIEKDEGVIRTDHKSYTGYQYQLLVNGIPAFQPHTVIEHTEELKLVDKTTLAELLKLAHKAADMAATAYMGGSPSGALKIGSEIVQQIRV